ncbi:MAG: phage tail protein [Burkholderiales bacterium]
MPRIQKIQSDFTSGEISPRLLARVDLKAYDNALLTMLNAYPLTHGGAKRRPGTVYVGEINNSAQKGRLIPFVYSKQSAYMLVFNNGYIEFVKNGSFIVNPTLHYSIASPYTEAELPDITYAQSGNVLFLAHPNHPPQQLTRTSDTNWTLQPITFTYNTISDQWYENPFIKFKLLAGGTGFVVGNAFTIAAPAGTVTQTNGAAGNGTMSGVTIKAGAPTETWTITCISAATNRYEFTVTGSVSGSPTSTWTTGNYPAAVTFFEQRLWLAGTAQNPQTLWGSKAGDYPVFTLGSNDSDAIQLTIASTNFDQLVHLESTRYLLPLSYGGEYTIQGGIASITPSSYRIRAQTTHGSNSAKPMRVAQEVLFAQKDGKKVRAISYSLAEDANIAPDITIFAEHITGNGVTDMTFSQDPDYIAWMIREDGYLLSLTHLREQQITAWARHNTDGLFESVASIPESTGTTPYLIVNRTINGVTKRYLEYIDYTNETQTDCALFGTDLVTKHTVWTGLGVLEGKTLQCRADGNVHPDVTVTGGQITLQYAANSIQVGIGYTTTLELLHPEVSPPDGTAQGRPLSVTEMTLRFQDTVACRVNGNDISFRQFGQPTDTPIAPFTGDKRVSVLGWRSPQVMKIEVVEPVQFTLLGVIMLIAVSSLTE